MNAAISPDAWFVLSGSLPVGVPTDFYATLTQHIRLGGGHIALDTSGEALRLGVETMPDLVKPNIDELKELEGAELSSIDEVLRAACRLSSGGIRTVVVSMGR